MLAERDGRGFNKPCQRFHEIFRIAIGRDAHRFRCEQIVGLPMLRNGVYRYIAFDMAYEILYGKITARLVVRRVEIQAFERVALHHAVKCQLVRRAV